MPEEICLSQYEKQIAWDQFPFSLIYLGGYVALVTSSWGSIFVFPDILVPPQVVGTARTGDQFSFSLIYLTDVDHIRRGKLGINSRFP